MTEQRASTRHVGTDDKEHLTKTLRDEINLKHCERRATHFTLSRCGVPTLDMCG